MKNEYNFGDLFAQNYILTTIYLTLINSKYNCRRLTVCRYMAEKLIPHKNKYVIYVGLCM